MSEVKKDNGYKALKRERDEILKKWGQWMKRAQIAEMKCEKLKGLILLVDPAVSNVEMNELSAKQWLAFTLAFPDEGAEKREHIESEDCWCGPELIGDYESEGGVKHYLHREQQ